MKHTLKAEQEKKIVPVKNRIKGLKGIWEES